MEEPKIGMWSKGLTFSKTIEMYDVLGFTGQHCNGSKIDWMVFYAVFNSISVIVWQ